MAKKITVLDAIHMAVEAWGKVKQSTIHNCFKKCLQDDSVQVDPIEVPEGYSREAWENQIDLEDFTEQEIDLVVSHFLASELFPFLCPLGLATTTAAILLYKSQILRLLNPRLLFMY